MLFGSDIILFSSLLSSLKASMSTLMGEFEWYVQMAGKKSGYLISGMPMVFVHLWFVIYICFALLVLFNMLLAMVLDSYGAAAQDLALYSANAGDTWFHPSKNFGAGFAEP